MSTRCQIRFVDNGTELNPRADAVTIYRHSDGYPECIIPELMRFLKWYRGSTNIQTMDIEYLSANLIYVWKKDYEQYGNEAEKRGFGICPSDPGHIHGDTEYMYIIQDGQIRVSEHLGYGKKPESWDFVPTDFIGSLEEAAIKYA